MAFVRYTELIGATGQDRIVGGEIYFKFRSTITYEIIIIRTLRILHYPIWGMKIDVYQS